MKKPTILYIDTAKRDSITVGLGSLDKKTIFKKLTQKTKAQNTLLLIEKLLKENGLELSDLTEIKINTGPGSFIGLRVGLTIANTFAFLLNILVNGRKTEVELKYL